MVPVLGLGASSQSYHHGVSRKGEVEGCCPPELTLSETSQPLVRLVNRDSPVLEEMDSLAFLEEIWAQDKELGTWAFWEQAAESQGRML